MTEIIIFNRKNRVTRYYQLFVELFIIRASLLFVDIISIYNIYAKWSIRLSNHGRMY